MRTLNLSGWSLALLALMALLFGCGSDRRETADSYILNDEIIVETATDTNQYNYDPYIYAYYAPDTNLTFVVAMMNFSTDITPTRVEQIAFSGSSGGEFSVASGTFFIRQSDGLVYTHSAALPGTLIITSYEPSGGRLIGEFSAQVCLEMATDCATNPASVRDYIGHFNVMKEATDPQL